MSNGQTRDGMAAKAGHKREAGSAALALPTVDDLKIDQLPAKRDSRGALFPVELPDVIDFLPVRLFFIANVPFGEVRGQHGHKLCSQYLIACQGEIKIEVFDGAKMRNFVLEQGQGLLLHPGLFATLTFQSADAVMLVLCDKPYDAGDYITSHAMLADFRAHFQAQKQG